MTTTPRPQDALRRLSRHAIPGGYKKPAITVHELGDALPSDAGAQPYAYLTLYKHLHAKVRQYQAVQKRVGPELDDWHELERRIKVFGHFMDGAAVELQDALVKAGMREISLDGYTARLVADSRYFVSIRIEHDGVLVQGGGQ